MILTKSLIFTWSEAPDGRNRAALDAKLAAMASENKTDGVVDRTGLVHKRNFVDTAAAQEFLDFYKELLKPVFEAAGAPADLELPPILTVTIVDNV